MNESGPYYRQAMDGAKNAANAISSNVKEALHKHYAGIATNYVLIGTAALIAAIPVAVIIILAVLPVLFLIGNFIYHTLKDKQKKRAEFEQERLDIVMRTHSPLVQSWALVSTQASIQRVKKDDVIYHLSYKAINDKHNDVPTLYEFAKTHPDSMMQIQKKFNAVMYTDKVNGDPFDKLKQEIESIPSVKEQKEQIEKLNKKIEDIIEDIKCLIGYPGKDITRLISIDSPEYRYINNAERESSGRNLKAVRLIKAWCKSINEHKSETIKLMHNTLMEIKQGTNPSSPSESQKEKEISEELPEIQKQEQREKKFVSDLVEELSKIQKQGQREKELSKIQKQEQIGKEFVSDLVNDMIRYIDDTSTKNISKIKETFSPPSTTYYTSAAFGSITQDKGLNVFEKNIRHEWTFAQLVQAETKVDAKFLVSDKDNMIKLAFRHFTNKQ